MWCSNTIYWILFITLLPFSCNNSEKKSDSNAGGKPDLRPAYAERFLIEKQEYYTTHGRERWM
jgi:hypothetical protein